MKLYTLVAINEQGASKEYVGESILECKRKFAREYDIEDFTARIYDNRNNGACVQMKFINRKTYQYPKSR